MLRQKAFSVADVTPFRAPPAVIYNPFHLVEGPQIAGAEMLSLQLITFGIIIAALVLAWGLLMALNPTRFWDLAKVDWNADVIDTHDRHKRHLVRIAGWIVTGFAFAMIVGLILTLYREI